MMSHLPLTPIPFLYFRENILNRECLKPCLHRLAPTYLWFVFTMFPYSVLPNCCWLAKFVLSLLPFTFVHTILFLPLAIRYSVHIWNLSLYLGKRFLELSYYYILSLTSLNSSFLLYISCNCWIMSVNYIGAETMPVFSHHCFPKV